MPDLQAPPEPNQSLATTWRACLLCSAATRPRLHVPAVHYRPDSGETYDIHWCDRCQLGRIDPLPDERALLSAYECFHARAECGRDGEPGSRTSWPARLRVHCAWRLDYGAVAVFDRIIALAGPRSVAVCDIGCGSAALLGQLAQRGHTVYGIEPSPDARAQALRRGIPVYQSSAEEFSAELIPEPCDFVVLHHVLEHCPCPLTALRNACRVLKPGGTLIVDVPNCACHEFEYAGIMWFHLDVPRHLNFFTPQSLAATLQQTGLVDLRREFYGYTRQFTAERLEAYRHKAAVLFPLSTDYRLQNMHSPVRNWRHLLCTATASRERKCDSVRMWGRLG